MEKILELTKEQKQIVATPKLFYEYLKNKYGVIGTEQINPTKSIYCTTTINIPGFPLEKNKYDEYNSWSIHLEKSTAENNILEDGYALILGENDTDRQNTGGFTSWKRVIQIQSGHIENSYSSCIMEIIDRVWVEKSKYATQNLKAYAIFFTIMEEFLSQLE